MEFHLVDYGERKTLLTTETLPQPRADLYQNVQQLEFLSHLSKVCRLIGSVATFNCHEAPTQRELEDLRLAFGLIDKDSIACNLPAYRFQPSEQLDLGQLSVGVSLQLQTSLLLTFGNTALGELPLRIAVGKYRFSENKDGDFTLHPASGVMSIDTGRLQTQLA